MGQVHAEITTPIQRWVESQHVFFVSTAPLSPNGHVNCSPKGIDSFRVLDPHTVVYQDLTGSGVETIAHVQENDRILIMFCAFEGPPRIVRFHGRGTVHKLGTDSYAAMALHFAHRMDCRAFISIDVTRVSSSCGYSVPLYDYVGQRDVLDTWAEKKGPEGLEAYRKKKNTTSIDGLPGF